MTSEATPTTTTQTADPRPLLFAAAEQALSLMSTVAPSQLDSPTPCSEFTVRDLMQHLIGVFHRVAYVAGGGHAFDIPSRGDGVSDDQLVAQARGGVEAMRSSWADDEVLELVLKLPFGEVPGHGAAMAYLGEITTHAWDLAVATGQRDALDENLGQLAQSVATSFIPEANRDVMPFESTLDADPEAGPYERLAAWLGRDPNWRG